MTRKIDIISITRDIIAAIHQFKGVLIEEANALVQTDKTALLEIAERKIRYADHLDQLVKTRAKMFSSLGIDESDDDAVKSLFNDCGQVHLIDRDWHSAMTTLQECETMNSRAGVDIQVQSHYVRRGLEVLGGKPLHRSYGANGYYEDEGLATNLGTA
ncbi:flagella synthesis protein FlgN [Litorivivens sp.]|uniref:flagella synthesis protein FlgN n=1 Tax=Litorivivens sp. TaxID=2020868 RepID=UPI003567891B